jgi:hypothetical protein
MYKILGGDGKEYGPVTADTLRQWVSEGRANAQTQIQGEGATGWTMMGQAPEFAALFAAAPPNIGGAALSTAKIPNYLAQSIIVTLCCCVPFGIVAIVYSAQVNTKLAAGDVAGAEDSSKKAKMWGWIAFGCGIAAGAVWLVLNLFAAGMTQRIPN